MRWKEEGYFSIFLRRAVHLAKKAETEIKQIQFLPLLPNIMIGHYWNRTILEICDAAMSMERFSLTFSFLG